MKTSVYVPDDLWEKAKVADPETNLSQLVQQVLRDRFGDGSSRPGFAQVSGEQIERREALRQLVHDQVVAAYQSGYWFGLEFSDGLESGAFVTLVSLDYDLDRFREFTSEQEL